MTKGSFLRSLQIWARLGASGPLLNRAGSVVLSMQGIGPRHFFLDPCGTGKAHKPEGKQEEPLLAPHSC